MVGSRKFRMNSLIAILAIAFLSGPTAPAQTGADDPNIQKAKDILLKGAASGDPYIRSLAVMSASLVGDRSFAKELADRLIVARGQELERVQVVLRGSRT
jgi:hypothetical protein